MRCAEHHYRCIGAILLLLLGGCATPPPPAQRPAPAPAPSIQKDVPPVTAPAPPKPIVGANGLPLPATPRSAAELRLQAARRLVAANPERTHMGKPQEILLAIPVLEVELNANGSVKRINVMRKPGQAPETLQMAIDAVNRAAPYGDVSHLPKPWVFIETFLFNNDRRFKPRTLDEG
ncbi:hypothetical protein ACFJGW_15185 [Burkholderiaceae bacterium UC74_6]